MSVEIQLHSELDPAQAAATPGVVADFDSLRAVLAMQLTTDHETVMGHIAADHDFALANAQFSTFDVTGDSNISEPAIAAPEEPSVGVIVPALVEDKDGYLSVPGFGLGVRVESTDQPGYLDHRLLIASTTETGHADFGTEVLQTSERSRLIARVARRLGKTARETWQLTRTITKYTAVGIGSLTLAGIVVASPIAIAHDVVNGPRDVAAGYYQSPNVEVQRLDGGPIINQDSIAYHKDPNAYGPVMAQLTTQPLEHGLQFAKGLYETGSAVAIALIDTFVASLAYGAFMKRRTPKSHSRGKGQLDILNAIFDGPEDTDAPGQQVYAL